jgi:hypothetical protein
MCFGRGFTPLKSSAMPTPATPSAPTPSGHKRKVDDAHAEIVGLSFEERLRSFWQNNSKIIAASLVVVLVAILAKGGWEYFEAQKENDVGQAYAAATTPAQLKTFAAAYPTHPLAGVADLRLADDAYGEAKYGDAIPAYEQAIALLKTGPLAARARVGLGMSKLQGGRAADGEAALKAMAADDKEVKAFRAEAAYHLASYAFANGKADDVKTYSDQLSQIDPASPWTQRALMYRAKLTKPVGSTN